MSDVVTESRSERIEPILAERDATIRELRVQLEVVTRERDAFKGALGKVNDIRNSIVGAQTVNWSEHVYPLVAALDAAGLVGQGADEARKSLGTLIDRATAAEAQVAALTARVANLEIATLRDLLLDARNALHGTDVTIGAIRADELPVQREEVGRRISAHLFPAALAPKESSDV